MKHFSALLIVILLGASSCDTFCDAGNLYGELKVKVTINDENPSVFVVIYDGKIENKDTLIAESVTESKVFYEMEAGYYYSATASYVNGFREIIAIDGAAMEITSSDDECDSADDIVLNLRLAD